MISACVTQQWWRKRRTSLVKEMHAFTFAKICRKEDQHGVVLLFNLSPECSARGDRWHFLIQPDIIRLYNVGKFYLFLTPNFVLGPSSLIFLRVIQHVHITGFLSTPFDLAHELLTLRTSNNGDHENRWWRRQNAVCINGKTDREFSTTSRKQWLALK